MPSASHDDLVRIGARWLKKQGFPVVATELFALGSREQPDVIGFRSTCSVVLEVKISRSDFLADARKPERAQGAGGLGDYRFYLCPEGLLQVGDLPPRWGLLYANGPKVSDVREIYRPRGNIWPTPGHGVLDWAAFEHQVDVRAERAALFSIARRLSTSRA